MRRTSRQVDTECRERNKLNCENWFSFRLKFFLKKFPISGDAVFGPVNSLRFAYQFRQQSTNFSTHSLARSSGNGGSTWQSFSMQVESYDVCSWLLHSCIADYGARRLSNHLCLRANTFCVLEMSMFCNYSNWSVNAQTKEKRSSCVVLASIGRVVRSFLLLHSSQMINECASNDLSFKCDTLVCCNTSGSFGNLCEKISHANEHKQITQTQLTQNNFFH